MGSCLILQSFSKVSLTASMNRQLKRFIILIALCIALTSLTLTSISFINASNQSQEQAAILSSQHPPHDIVSRTNHRDKLAVSSSLLQNCPKPNRTGIYWEYYTLLPRHNLELASRVSNLTHDPIIDNERSSNNINIPHRLIFTHYINLLNCSIWKDSSSTSSGASPSPQLFNLAQNVRATINAYKRVWEDVQVVFLTDEDCVSAITEVKPALVGWFRAVDGMYKADICRAAFLWLHGGYYFDVDVLVIRPYVAPQSSNFISIKGDGWPSNGFFQAFLAASPGHTILLQSIDVMLEMLWKNNRHYLGPMSLMDAWVNYTKAHANNDTNLLVEVNLNQHDSIQQYSKLNNLISTHKDQLMQHVPKEFSRDCQFSSGACNFAVVDEMDETIYFYSRLIGTTWCGKQMRCAEYKKEDTITNTVHVDSRHGKNESGYVTEVETPNLADKMNTASPIHMTGEVNLSSNQHPENLFHHFDDALQGHGNTYSISQPPPKDSWLIFSSNTTKQHSNRIPKIINHIYFSKDGHYPAVVSKEIRQAHQTWRDQNPGYQLRYFNLIAARRYLRKHFHPVFLRAFDCIEAFAGKSDLFRMALLYREGGFHTDWKTVCLEEKLLERIANGTDFFAALDYGGGFVKKSRSCAANAFVGASPQHHVVASYLEFALKNVQSSLYGAYVLMTTGPCVLGRAILTHDKTFGNDTASWPIHLPGYIHWRGEDSPAIVATKCHGCGEGQDWEDGNNYMSLWKNKEYYCQDAASIFNDVDTHHSINKDHLGVNSLDVLSQTFSLGLQQSTKAKDYSDVYTTDALKQNPYLGWQPSIKANKNVSFSWRNCFNNQSIQDGCRESSQSFGEAPKVDDGWIPDVTMVRTMLMHGKDRNGNTFPLPLGNELCENMNDRGGNIDDANKECLSQAMIRPTGPLNATTVTIDPSNHFGSMMGSQLITVPAPRLFCLVYTMSNAHSSRIVAMRETWAGGCDGFLAFSTQSDPRLPAISIEHDGPEEYTNMWQKVRSIWKFVAHYLDDFDWFFIGGDDLFVLPHNLKTYLASLAYKDNADPKSREYFVGRRFKIARKSLYFNSGGAGYALSQATLRKFLAHIDDTEHCSAHKHTAEEDVEIASCLSYLGISVTDTRDSRGRERFHPFSPATHYQWQYGDPDFTWYQIYSKEWGVKTGKDCCAPDSVSFHYVQNATMVRHLQALLYYCDR